MNNERRKLIQRAADMIVEVQDLLREAGEGEREYYDNMPESIREGDKGERANEVADLLEQAVDDLENVDLSDALS